MIVGTSETGEIIGRDEESFIIVRQLAGIESMLLIPKNLCSGLSGRFVKLNVVLLSHESKSRIFNRPMEKDPF